MFRGDKYTNRTYITTGFRLTQNPWQFFANSKCLGWLFVQLIVFVNMENFPSIKTVSAALRAAQYHTAAKEVKLKIITGG
jgi:hypothetical protein